MDILEKIDNVLTEARFEYESKMHMMLHIINTMGVAPAKFLRSPYFDNSTLQRAMKNDWVSRVDKGRYSLTEVGKELMAEVPSRAKINFNKNLSRKDLKQRFDSGVGPFKKSRRFRI